MRDWRMLEYENAEVQDTTVAALPPLANRGAGSESAALPAGESELSVAPLGRNLLDRLISFFEAEEES